MLINLIFFFFLTQVIVVFIFLTFFFLNMVNVTCQSIHYLVGQLLCLVIAFYIVNSTAKTIYCHKVILCWSNNCTNSKKTKNHYKLL